MAEARGGGRGGSGGRGAKQPRTPRGSDRPQNQRSPQPQQQQPQQHGRRTESPARGGRQQGNSRSPARRSQAGVAQAASSPRASPAPGRKPAEFVPFEDYMPEEEVYRRLADKSLMEGTIRINAKRYEDAYIPSHGLFSRDVLLAGMAARNRALEGDAVAVEVFPRAQWKLMEIDATRDGIDSSATPVDQLSDEYLQPTGRVVRILKPVPNRLFVGTFRNGFVKGQRGLDLPQLMFSPKDSRVPRITVTPSHDTSNGFKQDELFVARITEWPADSPTAFGEIVKKLGSVGDIEAETEAILLENGVDISDFPEAVNAELPQVAEGAEWAIPEEELAKRRDIRAWRIFSVDPPTARDIDDALSCTELPDGCFEVGVHIADVSFFVRPGMVLDGIAADRATTTYLVQRAYPMLPRLLCENLCSLNENVDRLAFSVVWKLDAEGRIQEQWIGRTVIRSCAKLSYQHAQAVIESATGIDWAGRDFPTIKSGQTSDGVQRDIINLNKLARALRARRFANGALRLDKLKLAFKMNPETGLPEDCFPYEIRESNKMIEEFMLLANMSVAEQIYRAFPDGALLRHHPPPLQRKLEETIRTCQKLGISLQAGNSGELQGSLMAYSKVASPLRFQALQLLCTQSMQVAKYFCTGDLEEKEFVHYALSVPFYTHFTSPIRRYADVVVHRQLMASLDHSAAAMAGQAVSEQADTCNRRKQAAKTAQDASASLFMCLYLRTHGPFEEEAIVFRVLDQSFDVYVDRFSLEVRVYCDKVPVETAHDAEKNMLTLVWTESGATQQITLLSTVRVSVSGFVEGSRIDKRALLLPPA